MRTFRALMPLKAREIPGMSYSIYWDVVTPTAQFSKISFHCQRGSIGTFVPVERNLLQSSTVVGGYSDSGYSDSRLQ